MGNKKEYNQYFWAPEQPRVYETSPLRISGTPMSEEDAAMSLRAENLQQSLQQNPIFKSTKQWAAQQEQREKEIAASKKWLELHPEDNNDDPYTIFERGKHQAIVDGKDPSYYEKMMNDGKQFTKGALTALSLPYLGAAAAGAYGYGASLGARGLFAGQGIYGLANKDGVRKTVNLIKSGDYGRAALSGAGDVLNAAMVIPEARFLGNVAKYGTKSAIAGDMLNQSVRSNVPNFNKPLVKYYGPTMGKTTAKSERLIDFDDIMRPIKESLAKDLGITREELVKSGHPALQQAYADQINLWRNNPANNGKTLMVSSAGTLDPKYKITFDNYPTLPERSNFIRRNVKRGGTEEESIAWYDDLVKRFPFHIDNRFVSEIESASKSGKFFYNNETIPENRIPVGAYRQSPEQMAEKINQLNTKGFTVLGHGTGFGGQEAAKNIEREGLKIFRREGAGLVEDADITNTASFLGGPDTATKLSNWPHLNSRYISLFPSAEFRYVNGDRRYFDLFPKGTFEYIPEKKGKSFLDDVQGGWSVVEGKGGATKPSASIGYYDSKEGIFYPNSNYQYKPYSPKSKERTYLGLLERPSKLSEAERLGIPKHERDWDYQFFKSIKEENPSLTSYIRTKHFAEQSPDNKLTSLFFPEGRTLDEDMLVSADNSLWKYYQNNKKDFPIKVTHKSPNDFYVFDYTRQSKYPDGHFFFSMHDRPQFGKGKISKDFYIYDKNIKPISEYTGDDMHRINKNTGNYLLQELDSYSAKSALIQDAIHNKAPNTIYGYDSGSNFVEGMYEFAVPRNTQMKLVDPITYDDNGHIIKLSKRDNFKNPDFRYKQGGILKRK